MSSFYTPPNVTGANGQVQYNDNGVLAAASGVTYDKASATISLSLAGVNVNLNTLLKALREAEEIRLRGSFGIGVPGTTPFGVGPLAPIGAELASLGAEHYNVVDIRSGSFC
jgi:hypothetical protein